MVRERATGIREMEGETEKLSDRDRETRQREIRQSDRNKGGNDTEAGRDAEIDEGRREREEMRKLERDEDGKKSRKTETETPATQRYTHTQEMEKQAELEVERGGRQSRQT